MDLGDMSDMSAIDSPACYNVLDMADAEGDSHR